MIDYNLNKVLSDNNPEVVFTCPVGLQADWVFSVKSEDRYTKATGIITTNNDFFKLFSIRVLNAISNKPFPDNHSAIIAESLVKKLFKIGEDPLGKPIKIANTYEATISAIVEDLPANSSIKATVFLNSENEEFRFNRNCNGDICINPINHYLLLNEKANPSDFLVKLNQNIGTYKFAIDSIGIQKLSDIYLDSTLDDNNNLQGNRNLTIVFMAIGLLIMTLSVINYLNYNLSLQYAKIRDIGIKRVNGARFRHLIGYYLTDVSVGVIISVDIALIIVVAFIPNINGLLNKQLSTDVLLNPKMLMFSIAVVILIIFVNTIASLYILFKFNISTFYSAKKQHGGKLTGRNILTAFQFTTAIALFSCVLIIQKQLSFAQNADLGFKKEHLLKVSLPANCLQSQVLKQEINKLPFVISSTLSHGVPGNIRIGLGSNSGETQFNVMALIVDDDFLKVMNMELTEGRWFLTGDIGTACIMNQEAIKKFGWKDIDNKRFNNGRDGGYQVVGVVKDFNVTSLHNRIEPVCLLSCLPSDYNEMSNISIRISPGEVESKLQLIQRVWKKVIPDDPMDYTFYDSYFDAMYRKEKMLATIIMFFSVIAIVLSCMGILGQVFQTCINRTKEIGIRKVNGASTWTVIRMLNFDFVKLILIAFVIACPLSFYIMSKWLQNFAYKTELNWWVFALAGVVILIISFITVTWHSWRTASRNPVEALRYE
jgi:putative ABC transport system permease protein